jgi:hypothetical protein
MAAAKTKIIVGSVAAALLVGVTGTIAYQTITSPGRTRQVKVDPAAQAPVAAFNTVARAPAQPPPTNWEPGFRAVYGLAPNQIVKHVAAPWIPERLGFYYQSFGQPQFNSIPAGPDLMLVVDDGKQFRETNGLFGSPTDVSWSMAFVLGIEFWDMRGDNKVLHAKIPSDWVVRANSTSQERLQPFVAELNRLLPGASLALQQVVVPREAIIIRGEFKPHLLDLRDNQFQQSIKRGEMPIVLFRGTTQPANAYFSGRGLDAGLAQTCNMPVILETKLDSQRVRMMRDSKVYIPENISPEKRKIALEQILENVSKQTSLDLKIETRNLPVWNIGKASATQSTTQPTSTPVARR